MSFPAFPRARRLAAVPAAIVLFLLAAAPGARAGVYQVRACDPSNDQPLVDAVRRHRPGGGRRLVPGRRRARDEGPQQPSQSGRRAGARAARCHRRPAGGRASRNRDHRAPRRRDRLRREGQLRHRRVARRDPRERAHGRLVRLPAHVLAGSGRRRSTSTCRSRRRACSSRRSAGSAPGVSATASARRRPCATSRWTFATTSLPRSARMPATSGGPTSMLHGTGFAQDSTPPTTWACDRSRSRRGARRSPRGPCPAMTMR